MPRKPCTVCVHPRREQIDEALKTAQPSLRVLARQVGLSRSALDRHSRLHVVKALPQGADLAGIDREIHKLLREQTIAKKNRDEKRVLRIGAELRSWHGLRAKVGFLPIAATPTATPSQSARVKSSRDNSEHLAADQTSDETADCQVAKLVAEITKDFDPAEIEKLKLLAATCDGVTGE